MASPRLALDPTPIKGKNSVPQAVSAVAAAEPRRIGRTTLVRLAVYYVIAGAALLGLNRLVAELPTAVSEGSGPFPGWADAALQMISALVLVLPMALVYVRTRTRHKYDASLVQTVIVLPITVAAVLIVVQNSLALAFSLAGIVAAVRFRNTLKESRDAVYIFGSLGIGFSTGVHQLEIALVLSLLFSVVELVLWKYDIGGADHTETLCKFCGDEAGSQAEVVSTATPDQMNGAPGPRDLKLRIFVANPGLARRALEPALSELAKRWEFVGASEGEENRYLDYTVHLKKRGSPDQLSGELLGRCGAHVVKLAIEPISPEPAVPH
jgi:hypothetical protein